MPWTSAELINWKLAMVGGVLWGLQTGGGVEAGEARGKEGKSRKMLHNITTQRPFVQLDVKTKKNVFRKQQSDCVP